MDEGETPNAGDGRQLQKREAVARGVAGEIPWEADVRKMCARKFKRDPKERSQDARESDAFSSRDASDAHRERGPDDSARDSEKAKDSCGKPRIDVAVLTHHCGDPRQADGIKNKSVKETIERSFARRRADGSEDEHADRNPCEQWQIVVWKGQCQGNAAAQGEQDSRLPAECHLAFDYSTLKPKLVREHAWKRRRIFRRSRDQPAHDRNCRWWESQRKTEILFAGWRRPWRGRHSAA